MLSIIGGSLLGPLTNKTSATHELCKALWRYLGLVILLNCVAPFYICFSKYKKSKEIENDTPSEEKSTIFTKYFQIPLLLVGAVVLISGWIIGQNWAFMNTV